MNSKIYKQLDSRWSSLPYPTKGSSFGGNGCGCCACTHIAIEQNSKRNWNIQPLRRWMIKQGFAVPGQGTTWSGITSTLKHIGHKSVVWVQRQDPMSKAWAELDKGNRIGVLLVDNSRTPDGTYWTSSGHYVAFTDYKKDSDGKHWFYIKDSGFRNHDGWFCYEKSIAGALPQLWIVERLDAPKEESDKSADAILDACAKQAEWMKHYTYKWQAKPTIEKSKKYGTCVTYVACVLQRLGLLDPGECIWHTSKGKVYGTTSAMDVMYQSKTLKALKSTLKAGDIVLVGDKSSTAAGGSSHIFIFAGEWSGDNPYIWDNHSAEQIRKGKSGAHTYSGAKKVIAIVRVRCAE